MNEFNGVEIVEEYTLDYSEPYKDCEPSVMEDTYADWKLKVQDKSNVLSNLFLLQLTATLSNPRFLRLKSFSLHFILC